MSGLARMRPDLVVASAEIDGQTVYNIKDPRTDSYFRLREPEYWLLSHLDGQATAEDVAAAFRDHFQMNISGEAVESFATSMDKLGLLDNGRTEQLTTRASLQAHRGGLLGRILYIKLKAHKPGRLLERLTAVYRHFHYGLWFVLEALVIVVGLWLLLANQRQFAISLTELWQWETLLYLIPAIFLTTWAHEFAHAIVCRYYGGDVREMGVLLMYFQPCFYCDVSDAWMFKRRRERLWVTWAGPYYQLIGMATAVILWRLTVPGSSLNQFLWMLVTINWLTYLFNFNPLIKLDGYYLLSDWLDIPNLRSKAFTYLGNVYRRYLLGWDEPAIDLTWRERRIYLLYGLLALMYSLFLIGYIYWHTAAFLRSEFGPAGLLLLFAVTLYILRHSFRRLGHGLIEHGRHLMEIMKKPARVITYLIVIAILVVAGSLIPIPLRVGGEVAVRPMARYDVYQEDIGLIVCRTTLRGAQPGNETNYLQMTASEFASMRLLPLISDNSRVQVGDTIAVLSTNEITSEIASTRAELARLGGEIALLEAPPKREEVEEARSKRDAAKAYLEQIERDFSRIEQLQERGAVSPQELEAKRTELEVARADLGEAQASLDLLLSPPRPEEVAVLRHQIDRAQSRLTFLQEQEDARIIVTPIEGTAMILDEDSAFVSVLKLDTMDIAVYVSDFDVSLVELGQPASIKVRSFPNRTFFGQVARLPSTSATFNDEQVYVVSVGVDNVNGDLRGGMTGYGKIYVGDASVMRQILRKAYSVLRVEFWSWW